MTDEDGGYRFLSVKPGAYPWGNHRNAWRPNHIHFSLVGPTIASRLVTQMYFPGDPLLAYDPIFQGTPAAARDRLIATFSLDVTQEGFALGYVFDIVLRGPNQTPMES
jgi:protocatechuate 3,4-dioxygenase beta subunit